MVQYAGTVDGRGERVNWNITSVRFSKPQKKPQAKQTHGLWMIGLFRNACGAADDGVRSCVPQIPQALFSSDCHVGACMRLDISPIRKGKKEGISMQPEWYPLRCYIYLSLSRLSLPLVASNERRIVREYQNQKYAYGHGASIPLILLASSYR